MGSKALTAAEIAAIRARCEAATPGPWKGGVLDKSADPVKSYRENLSYGGENIHVVVVPRHPLARDNHAVMAAIAGNGPDSHDNSDFIAAARSDIPVLLDHIDALQAKLDEANTI